MQSQGFIDPDNVNFVKVTTDETVDGVNFNGKYKTKEKVGDLTVTKPNGSPQDIPVLHILRRGELPMRMISQLIISRLMFRIGQMRHLALMVLVPLGLREITIAASGQRVLLLVEQILYIILQIILSVNTRQT